MRGPFEHLLVAKILDLRLGAMLRFLVATTMLATISITILIIGSSCISSSKPTEATRANGSTNSHREGRVSSDEKPRADPPRCGQPVNTFSGRIVDGKIGSIAEFPWIVSLQREKSYWFGYKYYKHACGGSLIAPSWIVTASHCFFNREYPKIVVAGTDNLDFLYRAQVRTVERVILHPRFEPATFNNDIALIKVNPPFNTDSSFSYVRPICFEPGIPVLPYDIATIAGFGAKSYKQQTTPRLYQTDIAIIDRDLCNRTFDGKITTNMICAGGMIPNKRDACSGDSGGPLQLEVEDHISLIGAVSFGNDCATKGFPGIYTKLNNYYAWVLSYLDEPLLDP